MNQSALYIEDFDHHQTEKNVWIQNKAKKLDKVRSDGRFESPFN